MNIYLTFVAGTFVGIIVGSIITLIGTLSSTWITTRSEERRQIRELGLRVALAKFDQQLISARSLARVRGDALIETPPFEQFLTYGIRLVDAVSTKGQKPVAIGKIIAESVRFSEAVTAATKAETQGE
jgi:hypothetical protein